MDVLDGVPKHVLGREIKTQPRVFFAILLPACLELIAYLIQTLADLGVGIQLYRDNESAFGCLTLMLIAAPAVVCFVSIVISSWQWPESEGCNAENTKFLFIQLFNLFFFPIGAILRFCRRIFWSIESFFHEQDTYEWQESIMKATENSPFELYHLIQAYIQAAPQVILQLYILLREDIFRNFETTNVQVLSIVFSMVNIAVMTMSYQRFESQKIVGRNYPWSTTQYVQHRNRRFQRTRSLVEHMRESKKQSAHNSSVFPETKHIMERFHSQHHSAGPNTPSDSKIMPLENSTADQSGNLIEDRDSKTRNIGMDELDVIRRRSFTNESDWSTIESEDDTFIQLRERTSTSQMRVQSMGFDGVPDIPPPPPPNTSSVTMKRQSFNPLNRLSTFTDMLVLNAEMYIKDHVPRPPRILIERTLSKEEKEEAARGVQLKKDNTNDVSDGNGSQMENSEPEIRTKVTDTVNSPLVGKKTAAEDEVDFFLPSRKKTIEGVDQDDFAGKLVSFFGWILFIFMRMISLSVFSVFYPREFVYLIVAHYLLMLLVILFESQLKEKCERILFYFGLAYIYIFVVMEFKIKFRHVRYVYIGFFIVTLVENFVITLVWYNKAEFYSWWFEFLFSSIMYSGGLTFLCLIVYYCILRPENIILLEDV